MHFRLWQEEIIILIHQSILTSRYIFLTNIVAPQTPMVPHIKNKAIENNNLRGNVSKKSSTNEGNLSLHVSKIERYLKQSAHLSLVKEVENRVEENISSC